MCRFTESIEAQVWYREVLDVYALILATSNDCHSVQLTSIKGVLGEAKGEFEVRSLRSLTQ